VSRQPVYQPSPNGQTLAVSRRRTLVALRPLGPASASYSTCSPSLSVRNPRDDGRVVDKDVPAGVARDESESLEVIEPFNGADVRST